MMPIADVAGARKFARGYLVWIKPRWATLAGPSTTLVYSVEILREEFQVANTATGARISKRMANSLLQLAPKDPYAHRLFLELRAYGHHLTGTGSEVIRAARIKRPKAQGNRERNGVRDLILSVLWSELQKYGLPKENKLRKGNRAVTPSIGVVIRDEMYAVLGIWLEPKAIMAAVLKRTEN